MAFRFLLPGTRSPSTRLAGAAVLAATWGALLATVIAPATAIAAPPSPAVSAPAAPPPSPAPTLTWETLERRLVLDAGSAERVVEFPFQNNSRAPVSIVGVKSSCECTVADLPAAPIAPGAHGLLKVRYQAGAQPGEKTVPLVVLTSEPKATPVALTLKATIQPVLTFTPLLLSWPRNSPADARQIVLRNVSPRTLTSLVLQPAPAGFSARLAPGETPGTWTLSVTPAATGKPSTARLRLQLDADGQPLAYTIYVRVL